MRELLPDERKVPLPKDEGTKGQTSTENRFAALGEDDDDHQEASSSGIGILWFTFGSSRLVKAKQPEETNFNTTLACSPG